MTIREEVSAFFGPNDRKTSMLKKIVAEKKSNLLIAICFNGEKNHATDV